MCYEDEFFKQNMDILQQTKESIIFVDPHCRTNRYFENIENLLTLRINDDDFIDLFVSAVETGIPILIDDIDDFIDLRLHNLLNKSLICKPILFSSLH